MRSSRLMSVFSRCLQRRRFKNVSQHRNISTLNKCKSLKTHLPDFKTNSNYLYRRTYYEAGHIYYRATLGFCIRSRHHRPHYSSIRFCSSHNSSDNPERDSLGTAGPNPRAHPSSAKYQTWDSNSKDFYLQCRQGVADRTPHDERGPHQYSRTRTKSSVLWDIRWAWGCCCRGLCLFAHGQAYQLLASKGT